jgi:hypothetical protein
VVSLVSRDRPVPGGASELCPAVLVQPVIARIAATRSARRVEISMRSASVRP